MTETVVSIPITAAQRFIPHSKKKKQSRRNRNDEEDLNNISDNIWNPTHENLLVRWDNVCTVRAVMHSKTAQYYERWHFWISMVAIFLAGASGISSFANLNSSNSGSSGNDSDNCSETSIGIIIAASVMALISGILQSSKEFIRFDVLSTDHRKVMADYEALRMYLQEAASFPRDIRETEYPVTDFLSSVSTRLQTLQTIACTIPDHILNQHIQQAKTILQPEEHRLVIAPPSDFIISSQEETQQEQGQERQKHQDEQKQPNITTSTIINIKNETREVFERSTTSLNSQQQRAAEDFTRFTDDIEKRVQEKFNINKK